jgi:hypothetical protein
LSTGKGAGSEHLCPQRIRFELLDVGLYMSNELEVVVSLGCCNPHFLSGPGRLNQTQTYSEITFGTSILNATRQGRTDSRSHRVFAAGAGDWAAGGGFGGDILRRLPQGVAFKLDGHDCGRGSSDRTGLAGCRRRRLRQDEDKSLGVLTGRRREECWRCRGQTDAGQKGRG